MGCGARVGKKHIRKIRDNCAHRKVTRYTTFSDGTEHLEEYCVKCYRHFGYLKQSLKYNKETDRYEDLVYI